MGVWEKIDFWILPLVKNLRYKDWSEPEAKQ